MPFQERMEELLAATGASRTTLRLDTPGEVFPIVAEALAPDVHSLRGETAIDIRGAATFQELERTLEPLIQDDCLAAELKADPRLLDFYGVRAQMLAPVVDGGRLTGIISVHYAPGPRAWSAADVAALRSASERVHRELGLAG